jgi:uncharacterized caspase-like protein
MTMHAPQPRNIEVETPRAYDAYRDRWAVLVGISKYKYHSDLYKWNLDYAREDAEELAKLFKEASYGFIDDKRMCKLCDEEATTAALIKALRSFLRKPGENDLVFLHFACHGMKDPGGRDEVYLVTHDTDPNDVPATALPMREVQYNLEHTLAAKRVVVLADTCHAGALIAGHHRSVPSTAGVMNNYLAKIGASKPGRAWLMSARENEVSVEGKEWGGGHGLFTHHVIQGLRKEAIDAKGLVTVGSLFDYVEKAVRGDSSEKQHPEKLSQGHDRELVIAVTGHLQAKEHFEIGRLLVRMGDLLDDRKRFEWATKQLETAAGLGSKNAVPMQAAAVQNGLARLALGEGELALEQFDSALKETLEGVPPTSEVAADARFYKPLALLATARPRGEALTALDEFRNHHADDPREKCASEMITHIEQISLSKKLALLIGVNMLGSSDKTVQPALDGILNDVMNLREALTQRLGFSDGVKLLTHSDATRQGILNALGTLSQADPQDIVVVYFGGPGFRGASEPYWAPYDFKRENPETALTATEIHQCLKAIPASQTIVVLDTDPNEHFVTLAREDASYTLLFAATPGEHAREVRVREGDKDVTHGALTWGLLQAIRQLHPSELTLRNLEDRVIAEYRQQGYHTAADEPDDGKPGLTKSTRSGWKQTPLFLGDESRSLFGGLLNFSDAFQISRHSHYSALTLQQVREMDERFAALTSPFPGLRYNIGRAYLELGEVEKAIEWLEREPVPPADLGLPHLALACAQLAAERAVEAPLCLKTEESAGNESQREAATALEAFFKAGRGRKRALLVGINSYLAPGVPNPRGAVADVDSLQAVLTTRWGFRPDDVVVLTDTAATREAILGGLRSLAALASDTPCLFVFSGVGSVGAEGEPTLLAVDSRQVPELYNDISFSELKEFTGPASQHLITVLDAGWADPRRWKDADRLASARYEPRPAPRALKPREIFLEDEPREIGGLDLSFGHLTLIGDSVRFEACDANKVEETLPDPDPNELSPRKVRGLLCYGLTSALWRLDADTATSQRWLDAATEVWMALEPPNKYHPVVDPLYGSSEPLFGESIEQAIVKALRRIEVAPLAGLVRRLERLVEKQDRPQDSLHLGLVCAILDRYDDAIKALKQARDHEEALTGLQAEARYYLGRTLLESGKEDRIDGAIGELRDAVQWIDAQADAVKQNSRLAGAYYYLGRALRDSARRNLNELSLRAFQKYLDAGAPLGHRDEVRRWINPTSVSTATPPSTR